MCLCSPYLCVYLWPQKSRTLLQEVMYDDTVTAAVVAAAVATGRCSSCRVVAVADVRTRNVEQRPSRNGSS